MTNPNLYSIVLLVASTCLTACAIAQDPRVGRLRERITESRDLGAVELSYGKDTLQKLDYWKPNKIGSPLVIFVTRPNRSNRLGHSL
jgi:hypothetical protein